MLCFEFLVWFGWFVCVTVLDVVTLFWFVYDLRLLVWICVVWSFACYYFSFVLCWCCLVLYVVLFVLLVIGGLYGLLFMFVLIIIGCWCLWFSCDCLFAFWLLLCVAVGLFAYLFWLWVFACFCYFGWIWLLWYFVFGRLIRLGGVYGLVFCYGICIAVVWLFCGMFDCS